MRALSIPCSTRRDRARAYSLLACAFFVLAIALALLKPVFDFAVSDGRFYYVYLPSAVIDGDLDFSDEVRDFWGPDYDPALLADVTPAGRVRNKYPVGLALTLAPSFVLAHGASHAVAAVSDSERFRPDGYSVLYQVAGLALVLALGLATFLLLDVLLVDRMGVAPRAAFLAIIAFWGGSHYAYYYFREPLMVHVVSTFWVTLALYAGTRERTSGWHLSLVSCAASMALVSRPTNALILLPVLARVALDREVLRGMHWVLLGAIPILVQLAAWRILHGSFLVYSYGDEGFNWSDPALASTLFSSKHGLIVWAPLLALSVPGVVRALGDRRARPITGALVVGFVGLWYANSSWHQWWFGDAFGARAFLELTPLFVIGLAFWFDSLERRTPRVRAVAYGAVVLGALYVWGLMALYVTHRIPRADYLF
ncbi:MAG: hypothetical protein GY711_20640 [bacterium]|nr:hypothetical protein [bacterium]